MTWTYGMIEHSIRIDKLRVYYHTQRDGSVRFYAGALYLEFTAVYETVLVGAANFASDYYTQKTGVNNNGGCLICGRPIINRNAKAVYCSQSCHDTAKWRRKNEKAKAS